MAIINQDEEEKRRQAQLALGAAPAVGGPVAGGGQPAAAPQAPQRQSYVGLADYLAANRGQGQAMAGRLAGDAGAKAQAAQTGLASLQAAAPAAAKAGQVGFAAPVQPAAYAAPAAPLGSSYGAKPRVGSSYQPRPTLTQQRLAAIRNPSGVAGPLAPPVPLAPVAPSLPAGWAPGGEAAAQAALEGTYKGPASLSGMTGYGQVQRDTTQAAQQLAGLTNEAARTAQMQQTYGQGGGYTPGMARYDSFLTGAAGGDQLQAAQNKYSGLAAALTAANADTTPFQAAQAASKASQQEAQGYLDKGATYANAQADYGRAKDAHGKDMEAQARVKEEANRRAYEAEANSNHLRSMQDTRAGPSWTGRTPYMSYEEWKKRNGR